MRTAVSGIVVGVLAGLTLAGGTAAAATGGSFVLGRANTASTQTSINNSGSGPVLGVRTRPGQAPLAVPANAGKATNLNADRVDGLDGTQLQRRTAASCDVGYWLSAVAPDGSHGCTGAVYDFVNDTVDTDSTGYAHVACDEGYAAMGGGYALPEGALAVATAALMYTDDDDVDGYNAVFRNLDGTPYAGKVLIAVSCITIDVQSAGNLLRTEAPRKPAPLR